MAERLSEERDAVARAVCGEPAWGQMPDFMRAPYRQQADGVEVPPRAPVACEVAPRSGERVFERVPGSSGDAVGAGRGDRVKRGKTDRETCELNGWGVGTRIRGHESWAEGAGTWSTFEITGFGEAMLLAKCIKHERTQDGAVTSVRECLHDEHTLTLRYREWKEIA